MNTQLMIRSFSEDDGPDVERLFVKVNRLLAPADMRKNFDAYITRSLRDEMGGISDYYRERNGSFWVSTIEGGLIGMFGMEPSGPDGMELRRMYVEPSWRRKGIARKMLQFAEEQCRRLNKKWLYLSTSEIQNDALSFYKAMGYGLMKEEVAETSSNKTIGGGIRRFHFQKRL